MHFFVYSSSSNRADRLILKFSIAQVGTHKQSVANYFWMALKKSNVVKTAKNMGAPIYMRIQLFDNLEGVRTCALLKSRILDTVKEKEINK